LGGRHIEHVPRHRFVGGAASARRRSWRWLSLPLLLLAWAAAAAIVHDGIFPGPIEVGSRLITLARAGTLLPDLGKTLLRSLAAMAIALPLGAALGVLLGRVRDLDELFGSWLTVAVNLPALIIGVLVYIWLGLTDLALVLAVTLSKLPLVAITLREGARALDPGYEELGLVYRLPLSRRLGHIAGPQLLPYLLAAARNGLALIWKIVLIFEILGSDSGVGFRIGIFFQHFDVAGILAYTAAFVACVFVIDALLLVPLEFRVVRWQSRRA
jgi:NitT/TauT family transport system permease protein